MTATCALRRTGSEDFPYGLDWTLPRLLDCDGDVLHLLTATEPPYESQVCSPT